MARAFQCVDELLVRVSAQIAIPVDDPFDRARVEAAFETSRGLVVSLQETGHTALLDQIETMSAEARADLADGLARAMRRGIRSR